MKTAIFSDIHANLEALHAVLQFIDKRGCDRLICLGDVVGYGPNPNECVELLRERADQVLIGNHDQAAIGLIEPLSFNIYARQAVRWTADELTDSARVFLRDLPAVYREQQALFVHASPYRPMDWEYILSTREASFQFSHFDEWCCFIGHSHIPLVFELNQESVERVMTNFLSVHEAKRYIINVGSVGQPRDGCPEAAFVIWSGSERRVEFCRVAYDFKSTQKKMRAQHLPAYLVERIAHGR